MPVDAALRAARRSSIPSRPTPTGFNLVEQLICHLFGDYVLQNHWMATNKVRAWLPAVMHAAVYTSLFLLLTSSPLAIGIIFGTHLLIDRFRLARYWVDFWGVGNTGNLWWALKHEALPWEPWWQTRREAFPVERAPDWLAVWLLIIVDNTLHLTINFLSIKYFG